MHQTQWSPERPLSPPVSLASQSHHEKPPEVTCTSRGNPGFPASTRKDLERPSSTRLVTSFSIPHDAADPVGYLFEDGEGALFVGTDMGAPTFGVRDALARATCAILESNHDPILLQTSDRPVSLKQRIAGRCGHLSNGDAADLVREVQPPRLKTLLLAHLSRQCNAPYLALESMRAAVAELGRPVTLDVLAPSRSE